MDVQKKPGGSPVNSVEETDTSNSMVVVVLHNPALCYFFLDSCNLFLHEEFRKCAKPPGLPAQERYLAASFAENTPAAASRAIRY